MIGQNFNNLLPFQVLNLLSNEDFEKVLVEKNNYLNTKERGGFKRKFKNNSSLNEMGIFAKVCDKIRNILIESRLSEPKIISINFLNHINRNTMSFHKHSPLPKIIDPYKEYNPPKNSKSPYAVPFEYFWIAIYYPHNLYDPEYAGELTVKLNENDIGEKFNAIPNSLVLHNGLYGHSVTIPKLHPTIIRDSCFTHWLCNRTDT